MAISLGDIKKKKITVSPIKNTNTNNTTYNVAPPVNNQREQQTYNLGDVRKNNITVTPLSERPKSKILAPSPQETMTINSINNKINENISKQIVSGGIQNDIHNMNMANIGAKSNKVTFESAYKDTGKKYGDYYYDNYESFKDKVIYERDGKYFLKTNKGYEPIGKLDKDGNVKKDIEFTKKDNKIFKDKQFIKNQDVNLISKYNEDKQELEKAKNLGYKDNLTKITSKEYDKAQKVLKEYKKQMQLSDKDYDKWLKTGKLPKKHGYFLDGDKTPEKAEDYRVKLLNGEIKKYDQQGFDVEKQIYMDTHNMSDEQKQQYISFITGKELPSNNEKSTFFKSSESDNAVVATLGTIGNAGLDFMKGTGKFIEGVSDFAENLIGSSLETSPIVSATGNKKQDVTTTRNNIEYTGYKLKNKNYWYDRKNDKLYDENWNRIQSFNLDRFEKQYTYSNGIAEFGRQMKEQTVKDEASETFDEILHGNDLRKVSVLGNKSEGMLESLGQAVPLMGAGGSVGGLYGNNAAIATTSGLTFSSSYGNAKTEALRNGATEKEAMETAFVQASAETISEQFFDSIPGAKSAGWGEKLVGKVGNGVEKYLGSKTAKIVTKTLDISGEGFEEIISNMLTAGGNDIVHYFDNDYNYGMENQTGNILEDMKSAMTSQDSMDSFVSAIITSAILNGGSAKVNSSQKKAIIQAYANEYNMSFNEAKSRLKIDGDKVEFDTSNIKQNNNTPNLPNNSVVEQRNINNNINNQINNNIETSMPTTQNNTNEKYSNVNPPMVIKYQETDNQKINTFRQSAVKEGMLNSKKTTDAMNVIEKIIQDKDYNVKFDRTITNLEGKSVDGKISINKNGEVEIALNPNSDRAVEFLLTHEVTHAIETKELRGIILDYANKNSEFKSALQDLQNTYGTTNVNDEVIADISGQILGNQEFINSLSMQNTEQSRGFISKVYHSIQRLLNKLTTKGRYRNFVEDLESKWREAYRLATNETTVNNLKNDEKYAKIYNSDGTVNRIKINDNIFENSKEKSISKTIKDYLTEHIGEVYTIIESGQKVYLGEDLPNEYAHSEYTKKLPLSKKLAKGRTVTNLNEIIESATNRTWEPNKKEKHKIDAKYGFYRYDTTFSFDYNGSEKIYDGTILIRNDANGKKYLYDILNIKPQKKLVNSPLVASNSNKSSAINSDSSNQYINNVPQSNQNVKSGTSTKYSMQTKENNTQELDNSSFSNDLSYQGTNHSGVKAYGKKITVDNMYKQIDNLAENNKKNGEALNVINSVKNNPNAKITIYRATPGNNINVGDWVFLTETEADRFSRAIITKQRKIGYKVLKMEVKAKDVDWTGKNLEFVFNPQEQNNYEAIDITNDDIRYSQESSMWKEHLDKNYKPTGTRTYFDEITNKKIAPLNPNAITKQNKVKPPIAKEYQKNTIEEKIEKNDDVIKIQAEEIANQLNNNRPLNVKERRWIETSTESEILKDKVFKEDLDVNKINYEVQSNKKSLREANEKLDLMGYDKSINYVKNLLDDGKIPTATDVALAQRTLQEAAKKGDTEVVQNLVMDVAILGTELGQATQALSIINKLTPEGQLKLYSKIVHRAKMMGDKSFQDVEITPEMVEMILNAYDKNGNYDQKDLNHRVEQFKQKVADQLKTSVEEKIDAWRYLSMLGNPKTHIRNIVSNVAMKCTIAYKNALARTIETIAPINTRTKTWKKASSEIKEYAKNTAIEMKNVITGESKYGEQTSIESKKRIFKFAPLENISNLNSNLLEAEDWFFSKSAFINTFQEYLTANGIKTMEDINNNPEIVEKGKEYSVNQAEIATFRQYSKLASAINKIERNNKAAKYVIKATIPFKKTPINVAKAGIKYSPIGLIKNVTYDIYQLKKGNINASQFIDNLSQGLSGTSLTILGYALAKAGILTGAMGDDKDDKYDSYLGKQGYSIKIGDKYYSLSWLSPTAMPLFVGANMHEQLEEKKDWDMNILSESLTKTLDPLNEMSFVSSLTDALNSYGSGNDKIKGMGESVVQSYIGQFFPTLFSQFANVGDDTKRSTKASSNSSYKFGEQTIRSIMYKIPGLRNKLESSTDIWGNGIKQNENILMRALESFILPYSAKEYKNSSIDKEIKKVYNDVGNTDVIPGFPQSYVKYDKVQYRMSAKEYTKFKKTYGTSANTMLNMLTNTSNYKNSTGKRKTRMIKKVYDYSREISKEEFLSNRKIDYDKNDFKYNKNDYKKIVNYITSSTQYKDDD